MLRSKQWKCCQEMVTGNTFESKVAGRKYHIRNNISWKIKKIAYRTRSAAYSMSERWRMCCTSEWVDTTLTQEQGRQKNQLRPTFANWITPWRTCKWGGSRRSTGTAHSHEERERERARASGSSPSERCLHMGWIDWISDVTAYVITVYAITLNPCIQALGGHQEPGYETMPFHRQGYKATQCHTGYTQLSALPAQVGITKSMTKQTTNVSMLLLWKRKADYNFHLTDIHVLQRP